MRLRLIQQPAWVRFTVWAVFLAVWWGLFTSLQSGYEFESAALSAIDFGAALGGYFTVTTLSMHRAAQEKGGVRTGRILTFRRDPSGTAGRRAC
jgi:hypothetical protein